MARGKKAKTGKGNKGQNRALGTAYLEKQLNKPEVLQTASGLLYEVLREIDAAKPYADSKVKVHYRVGLVNGKIFSDTYKKDAPRTYQLNEIIDGLSEGLQLMGVGSKYRLIIPPDLAWGSKGSGSEIGPDAVIIWTVELVNIL